MANETIIDMSQVTTLEEYEMLAQQAKLYTDMAVAAAGAGTFVFNQMTASARWEVAHNLNRYPSVTVVDSAGREVCGDVEYTSVNSVVITFSAAFSGTAYLN